MFWPGKKNDSASTSSPAVTSDSSHAYTPGVYNSELSLGDTVIQIQVALDNDRVKSVELINLEESVETMYPLIKPAVKEISDQLAQNISPEEVVLSDDSPYTSQMILDRVSEIMKQASVEENDK